MRPRHALAISLLIACGRGAQPGAPDAAPIDSDANGGGDDAPPDASTEPELVPPVVIGVEPTAEMWLHEPLRFVFDEPVDISNATVTATLDGAPVPATFALDGDRVLAVTLDASVRGVGAVKVALGGMIRDQWGNVAALPIEAERVAARWHRPGIDRGPAAETPSIAMGAKYMLAAWTVGNPRAVVVSKYAGTWKSLAERAGERGDRCDGSPARRVDRERHRARLALGQQHMERAAVAGQRLARDPRRRSRRGDRRDRADPDARR